MNWWWILVKNNAPYTSGENGIFRLIYLEANKSFWRDAVEYFEFRFKILESDKPLEKIVLDWLKQYFLIKSSDGIYEFFEISVEEVIEIKVFDLTNKKAYSFLCTPIVAETTLEGKCNIVSTKAGPHKCNKERKHKLVDIVGAEIISKNEIKFEYPEEDLTT